MCSGRGPHMTLTPVRGCPTSWCSKLLPSGAGLFSGAGRSWAPGVLNGIPGLCPLDASSHRPNSTVTPINVCRHCLLSQREGINIPPEKCSCEGGAVTDLRATARMTQPPQTAFGSLARGTLQLRMTLNLVHSFRDFFEHLIKVKD